MIGTYIAILAALMTAQQYSTKGWSAAVMSAAFWLLVFGLHAAVRQFVRYVMAKAAAKGRPA